MEGIREVALAHYEILPIEEKAKIERDFKWSVERGSVSEYFKSLDDKLRPKAVDACLEACEGYKEGRLDFNDFITLKYMMLSSMEIIECDGCSTLILGRPFFSCYECLSSGKDSYDLCCGCFISKRFEVHNHREFYDNYKLQRLGRRKLAETERHRDARKVFIERVFINCADAFVEKVKEIKTYGWQDYLENYELDSTERLDEISGRVKELQGMSVETEVEDEENSTRFMGNPQRLSIVDIIGVKPRQENEDPEEISTRFSVGDLLGVEASGHNVKEGRSFCCYGCYVRLIKKRRNKVKKKKKSNSDTPCAA